ncbi:5'-methylthioadenosine/S-adenosylhomocysteine nucleosidase [Halomonas daqingensis]|uniref:5'-methylthioadenosine/S-adenosylhomocysteine nucleosidase n=1 Tax=Billgrantia desiderata TaxID=52021 RepID=A0ABS9B0F8_9GAMM|nr:5'-methylthioadenosine/S-adenosylhomocysteine nucleosidase [Halomonas desiderata]MCE8027348.1 5'-methylthioadenosine/S-adenosylhomocysteine nucleosidase [Halomonas desiderata]MCE8041020.1 5'-methylthioadenosine/S-adenosylhomocysteine nucleosidase [Halomonas desiderata]MCE8045595.1 5'-methylthioadenosine/S-adenosylhomocysteine nucleosidase [Halomonas desiderata]OUE42650.1 5'-methylthioadenosine/S-adenosylhomocysteine nucleosidase [Halomonas desiderata SP1]SEF41927.1 adenosylhomocysteine nucl
MKRIGIIGAMAQEVDYLASQLEDRRTRTHVGCTFHHGKLHGVDVVILQSGIGKVNAAIGTTLLLDVYQPEAIINTGSAGGFGEGLEIGDIVVSSEVRHHDVDAVAFGYEHGQVPQMPAAYLPDARLVTLARECVEELGEVKVVEGLIATGDVFMACPELVTRTRSRFPTMLAAEMEAAAIAQTCHLYGCPFVVVRALSDIPGGGDNHLSFDQFLEKAAAHSARMVELMVLRLGKTEPQPDIELAAG